MHRVVAINCIQSSCPTCAFPVCDPYKMRTGWFILIKSTLVHMFAYKRGGHHDLIIVSAHTLGYTETSIVSAVNQLRWSVFGVGRLFAMEGEKGLDGDGKDEQGQENDDFDLAAALDGWGEDEVRACLPLQHKGFMFSVVCSGSQKLSCCAHRARRRVRAKIQSQRGLMTM